MPRLGVETNKLAQAASLVQEASMRLRETAGAVQKGIYDEGVAGGGGDMVGVAIAGFGEALIRNLRVYAEDAAGIANDLLSGKSLYENADKRAANSLQVRTWFVK